MNERIALLAQKASDPKTGWLDRQKFAELIVRECAEIAKKVDGDESDDYQSGRTWAGIDVLEHFGVKE